ncbi:MAG: hypothetical protein JNL07_01890, partial [Rhodospirillales bacterium]|nr:hypothetical protein [Rhodospirillales bacterium]
LEGAPEIAALLKAPPPPDPAGPVLPLHFRKGTTDIRLFTVMATLGSPRDVALQETMVEFFFPMDSATAALFRKWAKRK